MRCDVFYEVQISVGGSHDLTVVEILFLVALLYVESRCNLRRVSICTLAIVLITCTLFQHSWNLCFHRCAVECGVIRVVEVLTSVSVYVTS